MTMKNVVLAAGVAGFLGTHALGAGSVEPFCPGDANSDLAVNFDDLNLVLEGWGSIGADPGDVDDDGDVDFDDLNLVLFNWNDCTFDYGTIYPDDEAWQIGLEMLGSIGSLTLPQSIYDRVERDLGLIRETEPSLADQTHSAAWSPSGLIIGLLDGADRSEYDAYNGYFQFTGESELFSFGGVTYYVVYFPGKINVERLASMYAQLDEVNSAEPDGLFGGQNYYTPTQLINGSWRWDIDDGFWDCFDGCDCHYIWAFEIDAAGDVTLLDAFQYGQSWCEWPR